MSFKHIIVFVNSKLGNTNSKGDYLLKNRFDTFVLKIFGIQKNLSQKYILRSGFLNKKVNLSDLN